MKVASQRRKSTKRPPTRSEPAESALMLIKGMNFLLAQARAQGLSIPAQILTAARDDLAGWAADWPETSSGSSFDNQHYQHLFDSALFPAAEMMLRLRGVKDARTRQGLARLFGLAVNQ